MIANEINLIQISLIINFYALMQYRFVRKFRKREKCVSISSFLSHGFAYTCTSKMHKYVPTRSDACINRRFNCHQYLFAEKNRASQLFFDFGMYSSIDCCNYESSTFNTTVKYYLF